MTGPAGGASGDETKSRAPGGLIDRRGRWRPVPLRPLLGVDASYLDAAVDELRARNGTVESYFADGLHLDAAAQEQLKFLLLE